MRLTPANIPEASVTEAISVDLEQQGACLKELHIDRAYLSSHLVRERSAELEIYCKAWPVRGGKRFHKQAFTLNWERQIIRCPAEQEMPFVPGDVVYFPKGTCAQCPLKAQCTTSTKGRSVSIHPDEALLIELRQRQQTPEGRHKLRERVAVEHTLAHIGQWQGRRARYRGLRKNLFDLRRCAVVHNLHVLARSQQLSAERVGEERLRTLLGSRGSLLYHYACAEDERPVEPERLRKSVGKEITLERDSADREQMKAILARLAEQVERRLTDLELEARTLSLKVRWSDFQLITRSTSRAQGFRRAHEMLPVLYSLLSQLGSEKRAVRLLGVFVSHVRTASGERQNDHMTALSLWDGQE